MDEKEAKTYIGKRGRYVFTDCTVVGRVEKVWVHPHAGVSFVFAGNPLFGYYPTSKFERFEGK